MRCIGDGQSTVSVCFTACSENIIRHCFFFFFWNARHKLGADEVLVKCCRTTVGAHNLQGPFADPSPHLFLRHASKTTLPLPGPLAHPSSHPPPSASATPSMNSPAPIRSPLCMTPHSDESYARTLFMIECPRPGRPDWSLPEYDMHRHGYFGADVR